MKTLLRTTLFTLLASSGLASADDVASGKAAWEREVVAGDGQPRSCVSCHGRDPRQPGRHARTGKTIQPMAPSIEPSRLQDPAKVSKWFKRNCKWTWGRECNSDEQRAISAYLHSF